MLFTLLVTSNVMADRCIFILYAPNAFANSDITCKRSSDIITVLYIACGKSRAVGGAQQASSTTGCQQKTTGGGGDKTSHDAQIERAAVTGPYYREFHTGLLQRSGRNAQSTPRFKKTTHIDYIIILYIIPEFSFKEKASREKYVVYRC
ncbi:hypothetical protein AB205_0021050 [Aquarana catesbeiana]|uniref:Uncharacterized protein n=1 Tax=Aquarana catesbeiana TaxID=8400 RepID=A0A2G9SBG2_AQUCT|nr:hypothetical protein AB205_0021050 [Aquarana catesbeiana]